MLYELVERDDELVSVSVQGPGMVSMSPQLMRRQYSHSCAISMYINKINDLKKAWFLSITTWGEVMRLYP